jgi:FkbM family methyltransferase
LTPDNDPSPVPFGGFAPNAAQAAIIALAQRSPLKRGAFRPMLSRLVNLLRAGPIDVQYQGAAFRFHHQASATERGALFNPGYNTEELEFLRAHLPVGGVLIDAGANVGALTLVMACLVGNEGRVFAFEPGPELFVKLQTNLALNSDIADRAVLYQCGLSDEVATLRWQECASNRGNAFLSKSEGKVVVPVNLLDEIPELNEAKVRFIKIDVEGMELRVLRGATRIIERTRCLVYFEAMPGARRRKSAEDHEDIFVGLQGFFEELGYDIVGVSQSGRLERVRELNFFQNNLAFPTERKFVLETRRGRDDLPSSVLEPTAETG